MASSRLAGGVLTPPDPDRCRECGGRVLLTGPLDEPTCERCGLIADEFRLDAGILADHAGFGVPLSRVRGATGDPDLPPRLRALNRQAARRVPRGLVHARILVNRAASELHLPPYVAEDAFRRVKRLHAAGRTRGRRLPGTVAACVLDACRERGLPRSLKDVAGATGAELPDVASAKGALAEVTGSRVLPLAPGHHLARVASEAGLPALAVTDAARLLSTREARRAIAGRHPETVAAAAISLACERLGRRAVAKRLAEAAGVSRQSLYDARRALASALGECQGS